MCNLSEGVYNNGFNNGYNKKAKESLQSLMTLIKNTGWSLAKAMQMLGIPSEKEAHYKQLLEKADKDKG